MPKPEGAPRFPGFDSPRFTQIPNQVIDELLADLSGAEWKVLSYIMRRTYGWHKDADNIGLKQLTDGIKGHDVGTGLSKSTVAVALKSLEEWGLIERQHNRDEVRGDMPTTYRVRLSNTGRGENRTPLESTNGHGGVQPSDTQKIDPQKKEQKNVDESDEQVIRRTALRYHIPISAARTLAKLCRDDKGQLRRAEFEATAYKNRGVAKR